MERDQTAVAGGGLAALEETHSAVSWGAVFAGAVAALALSFVLLALAAGFGLSLASPWPGARAGGAFTPELGAWMVAVQVVSTPLGGYLAGRLRTRWANLHGHEAHFRDTAHGLLVWAVCTLAGVVMAAVVLPPAADVAASSAMAAQASAALATGGGVATSPTAAAAAPPSPAEIDRARKVAAQVSFFTGFGLLLSAFTACVAAALGGLRREEM